MQKLWKGALLYNSFDFIDRTIAPIWIPVLNEKMVYSYHTRVHGIRFQSLVLPNGLIINIEKQWEDQRHDCVLSSMNRIY